MADEYDANTGECWQCWCGRHGHQHTNGPCRCTQEFREKRRAEYIMKKYDNVLRKMVD